MRLTFWWGRVGVKIGLFLKDGTDENADIGMFFAKKCFAAMFSTALFFIGAGCAGIQRLGGCR